MQPEAKQNHGAVVEHSLDSLRCIFRTLRVAEHAKTCIDAAKDPATLKAYRSDWNDFTTWCWKHQRTALPTNPQTVVRQRAEPYLRQ